jgi:hypothetical protein
MPESRSPRGWERLFSRPDPFRGDGRFPIPAYSELMPAPWVGRKPSGGPGAHVIDGDVEGFGVSEYEEAHELRPGLERIGQHLLLEIRKLAEGKHAMSKALLEDNPYWPASLAAGAGALSPERSGQRCALILSLALSRTLDDKGRVRWTLFGASHEGPARPFWQSFYSAAGSPLPDDEVRRLFGVVLEAATGLAKEALADPRAAGVRILRAGDDPDFPAWSDEPIPEALRPLEMKDGDSLKGDSDGVKILVTFRPFARLPEPMQAAYLAGRLQLVPFPGSLVFFGHRAYRSLARQLPGAMQIPLLHLFPGNHAAPVGIRIPQSGWLDEPRADAPAAPAHAHPHGHGPIVTHVKRTSRWNRTHRDEDETAVLPREEKVAHVLFSTEPEELGLYGKPMARNAQLWTHDPTRGHCLVMDGPVATPQRLHDAARALQAGGHFGYRFLFPAMRTGDFHLYWHRPLIACSSADQTEVVSDGPLGFLTAEGPGDSALLWPRLLRRAGHLEAADLYEHEPGHRRHTTTYNVRKLLDAAEYERAPLEPSHARALLTAPRDLALDAWLDSLPSRAADAARGRALADQLRGLIRRPEAALAAAAGGVAPSSSTDSLTFAQTATRAFEEHYFKTIAELAEGRYRNKDNADHAGAGADPSRYSDLPALADELHARYHALIQKHGMTGRALVGDHWFRWRTDFDYSWSGGWLRNQTGQGSERNVVLVIPGADRRQAVVMGDHYDTAYMEDVYEKERGGDLTRRSAAGADDNHSATAALLCAADVLLPLARAGRLRHDVWLVHLTGEEFPSDCLGARNLVQRLIEGNLCLDADGAGHVDLSGTTVRGAYILDMVAHNNDHERYVFQISPGEGAGAARLARTAHFANHAWNESVAGWNRAADRHAHGPSQRMDSGATVPPPVAHPHLHGEIRPGWHFQSSLYNTDAQIFSDAGIPVVLFMENYDINRQGYHDTHDTMKNIDLDYGAALTAIAIESVARSATDD